MRKVFFGWYIVAAAVLIMSYGSVIFVYGFTAFIAPIAATSGWSYAQISFAASIHGLETGTLAPIMGMAVDRWPARRLVIIGIIIYGLGIVCISQASTLTMFYIGYFVAGLGGSIGAHMVPITIIARWFKRNLGKASGILTTGAAIGGLFTPLLVKMIDAYGWQTSLLYLAVGLWILGIPLSFVFRSRPEDYGLLPDGKPQGDAKGASNSGAYDFSTGVKEALKTRAFWYLGVASMFQQIGMHAVVIHIMPYLTSFGMERTDAAMVVMIVSIVTIAGRIPFGFLADIFIRKYIAAVSCGLITVALLVFWFIDGSSWALVLLFAVTFGVSGAGFVTLRPPIIREYYGTKKFGTIYGLFTAFTLLGSVIGPPVAGWVFDTFGVYGPTWLVMSGLAMIGTVLLIIMPPASRKLS
jgi:sugar phosphate permease